MSPKPISLRGVKLCELVDGLPRIFENKKGEEEVVPFLWQQEMGRIPLPLSCFKNTGQTVDQFTELHTPERNGTFLAKTSWFVVQSYFFFIILLRRGGALPSAARRVRSGSMQTAHPDPHLDTYTCGYRVNTRPAHSGTKPPTAWSVGQPRLLHRTALAPGLALWVT